MAADTTPQHREGDDRPSHSVYVRVSDEPVHRTIEKAGGTVNVDVDRNGVPVGVEVLGAVSVTINGRTAQPIPSFPEGDIVDRVTAALQGYRHQLGPNAIGLIRDGVWKSLPLSLGEMRDIAWLLQQAGLLLDGAGAPKGESRG